MTTVDQLYQELYSLRNELADKNQVIKELRDALLYAKGKENYLKEIGLYQKKVKDMDNMISSLREIARAAKELANLSNGRDYRWNHIVAIITAHESKFGSIVSQSNHITPSGRK